MEFLKSVEVAGPLMLGLGVLLLLVLAISRWRARSVRIGTNYGTVVQAEKVRRVDQTVNVRQEGRPGGAGESGWSWFDRIVGVVGLLVGLLGLIDILN